MSVDYGEWDSSHLDRSLQELGAALDAEIDEDKNKQFRAICLFRDFDLTHLRARPLQDPVPEVPTDDDGAVWPGADNLNLYDWFTMYDHYSDGTLDSEVGSTNTDIAAALDQSPEKAAELNYYFSPYEDTRENKIRRLVAYNFPDRLNPYPTDDIPSPPDQGGPT
jgi:hypothetical protein